MIIANCQICNVCFSDHKTLHVDLFVNDIIISFQKFAEALYEKSVNRGIDCDIVNLKDFEPEDNLPNEVNGKLPYISRRELNQMNGFMK